MSSSRSVGGRPSLNEVVLDASVTMAAVLKEPGGERVVGHTSSLFVSAVNYAETLTRLADRRYDRDAVGQALRLVPFRIVGFDQEQAELSADLRLATKALGLSLGDRACLARAVSRGAVAVTADRAWARGDLPVELEVVR
jgi:PIN domain nuclease of toxin-antitoxin system